MGQEDKGIFRIVRSPELRTSGPEAVKKGKRKKKHKSHIWRVVMAPSNR